MKAFIKFRTIIFLLLVFVSGLTLAQEKDELEKKRGNLDLFNFLNSEIVVGQGIWNMKTFKVSDGKFPELELKSPAAAKLYMGGDYSLNTRWFDADANEIDKPVSAGRYAYYAEIRGKNGLLMRKASTVFGLTDDWVLWSSQIKADIEYFQFDSVPRNVWEENSKALQDYSGKLILESFNGSDMGNIFLAFLHEMNRKGLSPSPNYTPLMMDGDYHAKIKQKILNVGNTYPRMAPPKRVEDPAPTLTHLSEKEKKKNAEFEKKMSELCHEWAEKGGEPFDILIAKDAKILFHDAFGENLEGKFSTDIPNEIASITKLISGLLFAQYVDQGLLGIDDYIGEYLPDFTVTGDSSLTFRACFTHVNGMWGHSSWGGVRRPWYDNSAALYMPFTSVGTFHFYNGDGYNLVGKVMEIISGKSIFRIMNEQLFQPLDLKNTFQDTDLAFGTKSTAHDIAVIAQMLLNRGKYGDLYFFSEETYKALLPVDLNNYFPGIKDIKWGIGIVPMNNYQEDEATGEKRAIISESGLGHGSATSSILRVYPDKNIVIGSSRMNHGKDYEKYNEKMLLLIEEYFVL